MKKSAYQKLKDENKQLQQDLYDIVMNPNKSYRNATWFKYKLKFMMQQRFLAGLSNHAKGYSDIQETNGIIPYISKQEITGFEAYYLSQIGGTINPATDSSNSVTQ